MKKSGTKETNMFDHDCDWEPLMVLAYKGTEYEKFLPCLRCGCGLSREPLNHEERLLFRSLPGRFVAEEGDNDE